MTNGDEEWMTIALTAAKDASANGEVPVGACVVGLAGELLAISGNRPIELSDPTAHAEILALRAAAELIGNYRLPDVTIYSTIEPCVMCAGALVNARVRRLIYGAPDERFGGVASRFQLCDSPLLNHRIDITPGVLEAECRSLMQAFFAERRSKPAPT